MNPKNLRVQGKGSVSQTPDRIRILFTISRRDSDFGKAIEKANLGISGLQTAADGCGIAPDELKTTHFNAREETQYESGKHQFVGFVVTHQVGVLLPMDNQLIGRLLSAVVRGKASPQVNLAFEISDPEALKQKVLASAVENAKRRAETIAMASGVRLGPIAQIEYGYAEVRIASQPYEMTLESAEPMAGAAPDFEPDDVEAEDTVTITWEIE